MASDVTMPRLSDSMEEGTILRWRKAPGDEVDVGDELVEIETDKAEMVYEADASGTLLEVLVAEGESAPIGAVIARIGEPGEAAVSPAVPAGNREGRVSASPVARRIAVQAELDLAAINGSGPNGRITKADVEAVLASGSAPSAGSSAPLSSGRPPSAPSSGHAGAEPEASARGAVESIELTRLQRTVARRMSESKAAVPHFYLTAEVDVTRCVEARRAWRATAADGELVPSLNDIVVKACALALRAVPKANGAYRDGTFELYSRVNVGIAVAADDALIVPTLFDADGLGLDEIARQSRALAERVRAGTVTPPELAGGTFTVSNLGMYGISSFAPVINPPQAAIAGVGEVVERPVLVEGELRSVQLMQLTLACDHRILYGAEAALLLAHVRSLLENPLKLAR